jgi:hypothetical protein
MAISPSIDVPQTGHPPGDSTEASATAAHSLAPHSGILLCLPPLPDVTLGNTLSVIASAFPGESVTVATPFVPSDPTPWTHLQLVPWPPEITRDQAGSDWVLAATDFTASASLLQSTHADIKVILLLSATAPEATLPDPSLIRALADGIRNSSIDLVLPRYAPTPTNALVNSALIYPLTRALFGADVRFPLPIEAAMSPRMAARLAAPAQRQVSLSGGSALLWPVAEAAIAGMSVREIATPQNVPQRPPQGDFNTVFGSVAGSLFADIETKASFWQRARTFTPRAAAAPLSPLPFNPEDANDETTIVSAQIGEMIESFRLAHSNLQEIWSLVLPPQSRLALKKLSLVPPTDFVIDPALWARIVYDFTISFHLRTLNRGHLLGAMVPLYLAWVASHLNIVGDQPLRADARVEATAAAFESEKSYLVSRWRWPDRFNP